MAQVHPASVVSPNAKIAGNVRIGPFCLIEDDVEIGAGTVLDSHVVVKRYTTVGENNHLYAGVVLGSDPQDKNFSGNRSYLRIGNDNIFREYSSASRGTPLDSTTVVGDRNYIMVGVHLAHNNRLGNDIVVCNNCSLAGYVEVEDGAFLSGGVVVHQFSKIGKLAMIGGNTRVNLDVPPYLLCSDFNVTPQGLNLVGLRRAGIGREAIRQLKRAYTILYRSHLPLKEALKRIEEEIQTEEARHLVEFIRRSERGICRERQKPTAEEKIESRTESGDL